MQHQDIPQEAMEYYHSGNAAFQRNNFTLAIEKFNNAIESYPAFGRAHFDLGRAYQQRTATFHGIDSFTKAIEHAKNSPNGKDYLPDAYYRRGCLHFNCKDFENAAADFSTAISMDPDDYNSYLKLAETYKKKSDTVSAIGACINGLQFVTRARFDNRIKNRLFDLISNLSIRPDINVVKEMIVKLDTKLQTEILTALNQQHPLPPNMPEIDSAVLLGLNKPAMAETTQTVTTSNLNSDEEKDTNSKKRNYDQISRADVIFKEEPGSFQEQGQQPKIRSIIRLDLTEASEVVRTLRGKSKAKYNCPQLSFAFLKYLLTSEKPIAQASIRPATSKDIQIDSHYQPIKHENRIYAQVSSLTMTHTGYDFPAPYTAEIHYEETQNGDMALNISLEKFALDNKHLEKVHYKKLNDFLKNKVSKSPDQVSRGLIFLPETIEMKYALIFMTNKNKPDAGHIEFESEEKGLSYRFTQSNGEMVTGFLLWETLPNDIPKDKYLIYNYQLNILPYILKQFADEGYIRTIQIPDLGKQNGHQVTYIADAENIHYIDAPRYKAPAENTLETPVEEYIYSDIEAHFRFLDSKNTMSKNERTYGEDLYCVAYPALYAKKDMISIKQEQVETSDGPSHRIDSVLTTTTTNRVNSTPTLFSPPSENGEMIRLEQQAKRAKKF